MLPYQQVDGIPFVALIENKTTVCDKKGGIGKKPLDDVLPQV
jgi:hypothetical protein